jgi:hypothetical protein
LTLGPQRRYNRWIEKSAGNRRSKGKILLDLATAPLGGEAFSVEALGTVIDQARAGLTQLDAIPIGGETLPDLG